MKTYSEGEVRVMRNLVYGQATTDRNWEGCRDGWMQPANVAWLVEQLRRVKLREAVEGLLQRAQLS